MLRDKFRAFAHSASEAAGSPWAFLSAIAGIAVWLLLGPMFGFTELWWLIAGTVCSMIPTIMVFLIQNMQNRDAKAMHLKLDELIRATSQARNQLIQLEAMTDDELEALEQEFVRVRKLRPRPLEGVEELQREVAREAERQAATPDSTRTTSSP